MYHGHHIDLIKANIWLLEQAGVASENIQACGIDTYTDESYFSARREGVECGRIINAIIGCALLMSRAWSTDRAGRSGSSNLTGLSGLTVRFVRAVHRIPPRIQLSDNNPT